MDPKKNTPTPDENPCRCAYRMLEGVETRIVNPRCPLHGHKGHLQSV